MLIYLQLIFHVILNVAKIQAQIYMTHFFIKRIIKYKVNIKIYFS